MSKIIIKDDDFESVVIVGEDIDEEFYDFLRPLMDAYDEGVWYTWLEKWYEDQHE